MSPPCSNCRTMVKFLGRNCGVPGAGFSFRGTESHFGRKSQKICFRIIVRKCSTCQLLERCVGGFVLYFGLDVFKFHKSVFN